VRLLIVLMAAIVLASAAVAAEAARPGFRYGVAAGEITSTTAALWTRAPRAGEMTLTVALAANGRTVRSGRIRALDRATDLTRTVNVRGLRPSTRYSYWFTQGADASARGTFTTAPPAARSVAVRFAISGDADATAVDGKPAYNGFGVYGRMAAERNDFNVNLGDTIYSDSEVGGAPIARTVLQKWGKYKLGLDLAPLRALRRSAGLYSHWDDHEFINDFSKPEHGEGIYEAGVKAFTDYVPAPALGQHGLYRTFRWGKNLELFFLDERSFRSAKADDICAGDLAPTAPQAVRDAFATLAPPLRNPVPLACLAALNDPARTMLGAAQYAAFTRAIRASTATWKVIVNEVPIQQYYALPYDRWEGYAAERERLLRFLQTNVQNVVFLTTDTHANLVNEVRHRTLGGAPQGSGMWEVVTGPVATNTFARRSTTSSVRRVPAPRSVSSSSSHSLRTGWACAAPPSTRTRTRR
jgi:alkaline phosphatase D